MTCMPEMACLPHARAQSEISTRNRIPYNIGSIMTIMAVGCGSGTSHKDV